MRETRFGRVPRLTCRDLAGEERWDERRHVRRDFESASLPLILLELYFRL